LLKGLAGLVVTGFTGEIFYDALRKSKQFPCRILGPSMSVGHKVRDRRMDLFSKDTPTAEVPVTIVGGGIAGLSAGWWLKRHGFSDFSILELEPHVGGNSHSGKNQVSAYPWGAHYVPLANSESTYVRILFEELGIINGYDARGIALYNELYLCHDPQERLLKDGSFQDGLVPRRGLQEHDKTEMARFFGLMNDFRKLVGKDGKPCFAIPLDLSSQDSEFKRLDEISMLDWLKRNNFSSKPLFWYVNYCCRDDYGSSFESVSAWAGVHYFAGRRGAAANAELNSVVTWPEGNGFIVNRLKDQLSAHIKTNAAVAGIKSHESLLTFYLDTIANAPLAFKSKCVIFAAPRFIAPYVIKDFSHEHANEPVKPIYAPWIVANISLNRVPIERGVQLAWDNVNYLSESLGYVVATHQNITTREGATVVTYYYPLSAKDPSEARKQMQKTTAAEWSKLIVADLETMHPGIGEEILSIDVWPWGHGMIRPSVGYIWGDARAKMKEEYGNIFFAHSDMSGMSNFEEAQYQGVEAAKKVLNRLRHTG
jgi:protoporphyrinogen oxidase